MLLTAKCDIQSDFSIAPVAQYCSVARERIKVHMPSRKQTQQSQPHIDVTRNENIVLKANAKKVDFFIWTTIMKSTVGVW